jgi:very-short-patch-repair endonuclease
LFEIIFNSNGKRNCWRYNINRLTTEKFIEKAKKIHGDKFDYSKSIYVKSKDNVLIICNIHGEFLQAPDKHVNSKHTCPKCCRFKNPINVELFIKKAKEIHKNKYDYSKIIEIRSRERVKIICKKHGEFLIEYYSHLRGRGCSECAGNTKLNTKTFIKKAKLVHQNKYKYLKVKYVNNCTSIIINCLEHGDFNQLPNAHLSGRGCAKCGKYSKGETKIRKWLESKNIKFEEQKRFNSCKNKVELPFDFYILNLNILIEYDGPQHFKSVDWFGGLSGLEGHKKRDKIKTKWSKDNGYILLRIKYTKINKIPDILEEVFCKQAVAKC